MGALIRSLTLRGKIAQLLPVEMQSQEHHLGCTPRKLGCTVTVHHVQSLCIMRCGSPNMSQFFHFFLVSFLFLFSLFLLSHFFLSSQIPSFHSSISLIYTHQTSSSTPESASMANFTQRDNSRHAQYSNGSVVMVHPTYHIADLNYTTKLHTTTQ